MPAFVSEEWPVANVIPALGTFTCWTLDGNGEWTPTDGTVVPEVGLSREVGLKASHPVPGISLAAKTTMLFTFLSASGIETLIEKTSSAPIVINGTAVEVAGVPADELGIWTCKVEYWEGDNYDVWGPYPIAQVVEDTGNGGPGEIPDAIKNVLIAGAIGVGAYALLKGD